MRLNSLKYVLPLLAVTLVACGDDDPAAPTVATENLEVAASASTVGLLEGATVSFNNGGELIDPALAGRPFTLTFSNTASASPNVRIVFQGLTLETTLSFGSCRFTVTSASGDFIGSTDIFPGDIIVIDPCSIRVNSAGRPTGSTGQVGATLSWGNYTSRSFTVTITIEADGTVRDSIGRNVGRVGTGASG